MTHGPTTNVDSAGGYVKLWRQTLRSEAWLHPNPSVHKFWEYCLMSAAFRDHKTLFGNESILLKRGQFIIGRKKAAEESRLSEQNVRTALMLLEKWGNLTIKSTTAGTVITICNYGHYQSSEREINQPSNQPLTSLQPASNQPLTTTEEGKEGKEDKEGEENREETDLAPAPAGDGDEAPPPEGQTTQLNTPTEAQGGQEKPVVKKKPAAPKKPREPDLYFDGLAVLFSIDPAGTGGGRIAKLKKHFIEHGADLAEVRRRAKNYKVVHPTWEFTGESVEKHWGTLDAAPTPPAEEEEDYGTPDDLVEKINQPVYGFDWWANMRHEPAFTAEATKIGWTLRQYLDWRKAWSDKNGPYAPERPRPPVEPPSLEAQP